MELTGVRFLLLLVLSSISASSLGPRHSDEADHIKLDIPSPIKEGEMYNLKLSPRPKGPSILHPNIQVISRGHDEETGNPILDHWIPTHEERKQTEYLHMDHENLAVVRVSVDDDGKRIIQGTVDGMTFEEIDGKQSLSPKESHRNATDYINLDGELPFLKGLETLETRNNDSLEYVVELAIVCDKEWGDVFQHDRKKILDYWTVNFWANGMMFRTLPNVNTSFVITSVTVISSFAEQPFIEETRDENGAASFGWMISKFGNWMKAQLDANALPQYDIAMLAINTKMRESGVAGMAYLGQACNPSRGVGIHRDDGKHAGIKTCAHEIGHILNAGHDHEYTWCEARNFIMEQDDIHKRYFFSYCSDLAISQFVKTPRAACLTRRDEPGTPPIAPGFQSVDPPTLQEQCKILVEDENATIARGDENDCQNPLCWRSPSMGGWGRRFRPVENAQCQNGNCFRGRCLPKGRLIVNAASGECLLGGDHFLAKSSAIVAPCPQTPTPMDKFSNPATSRGKLSLPYSTANATENADKCLWGGMKEGDEVEFEKCPEDDSSGYGWFLAPLENDEFYILNGHSQACVKPTVNGVITTRRGCGTDPETIWKFQ